MITPRYFSGKADAMGVVTALPHGTFGELVDQFLGMPVRLAITKAELMAMGKTESMNAKRTDYLVPCVFKASPSPRKTELAVECNLDIIDIDDTADASRLLASGFDVCGVDASARFDRSDYGLSYGVPRFSPEVKLQIQAEAVRAD